MCHVCAVEYIVSFGNGANMSFSKRILFGDDEARREILEGIFYAPMKPISSV